MTDEVLAELWKIKDNIAKEHAYDIDRLAAYYQAKQNARAGTTVQEASKKQTEPNHPLS